jgi:hypothetical protein
MKEERKLLKVLGGLSVVPLTIYPGQLGYTGLFLVTLRLS